MGRGGRGTRSDLLSRKTSPALIKSGRDRRGGRSRWERSEARGSGRLPAGAVFEMQGWTGQGRVLVRFGGEQGFRVPPSGS